MGKRKRAEEKNPPKETDTVSSLPGPQSIKKTRNEQGSQLRTNQVQGVIQLDREAAPADSAAVAQYRSFWSPSGQPPPVAPPPGIMQNDPGASIGLVAQEGEVARSEQQGDLPSQSYDSQKASEQQGEAATQSQQDQFQRDYQQGAPWHAAGYPQPDSQSQPHPYFQFPAVSHPGWGSSAPPQVQGYYQHGAPWYHPGFGWGSSAPPQVQGYYQHGASWYHPGFGWGSSAPPQEAQGIDSAPPPEGPNRQRDVTGLAEDLRTDTPIRQLTRHLSKRVDLFRQTCEHFYRKEAEIPEEQKVKARVQYIPDLDFSSPMNSAHTFAHISIIPELKVKNAQTGRLEAYDDERWTRAFNACDAVENIINRIDDEIESEGRKVTIGLLKKVSFGLPVHAAEKAFIDHIKKVLGDNSRGVFKSQNLKQPSFEQSRVLARALATEALKELSSNDNELFTDHRDRLYSMPMIDKDQSSPQESKPWEDPGKEG